MYVDGAGQDYNLLSDFSMLAYVSVEDIQALILFGIIVNFLFSLLFGWYLSINIGVEEMMLSKGDKRQPSWMVLTLVIPFVKMGITLYRVAILQLYFLNQGRSHKDFWVYLTKENSRH